MGNLNNSNKRPELNPDIALESINNDQLGRKGLVKEIAEIIINHKKSDSLIIGLYGSWGYGKSTLLNFVKEHIKNLKINDNDEEKEIIPEVLSFDPWIFANQEQLVKRFIEWLVYELGNLKGDIFKNLKKNLKRWLFKIRVANIFISKDLVRLISALLILFGIPFNKLSHTISFTLIVTGALLMLTQEFLLRFIEHRDSLTLIDLRDELSNELLKLNSTLVIFIDEIDRLNKEETKLIFQLVKSTFNLPNLIFVLTFDKEKVSELISENNHDAKDGEEYIEKIVQLPIRIPPPDNYDLGIFIDSQIKQATSYTPDDKDVNNLMKDLFSSGLYNIIAQQNNPRKIIRLSNYLKCHLFPIHQLVNPADFIALSIIHIFYPSLYNFILSYKEHFVVGDSSDLRRQYQISLREKKFQEKLKSLYSGLDNDVITVLKKLFPVLENTTYGQGYLESWDREKRICSSKHIDTYFIFKIPQSKIDPRDFEHFVNTLNTPKQFLKYFEESINNKTFHTFLNDLSSHIEKLPNHSVKGFIIALITIIEKYPKVYDGFLSSPTISARNLIKKLLSKRIPKEASQLFSNAVNSSDGITLPVLLLNAWLLNKEKGELHEIQVDDNMFDYLKSTCIQKIEEIYINDNLLNIKYLDLVLLKWKEWTKEDFKLKAFIDKTINDIERLPQLLKHFVDQRSYSDSISSEEQYAFDFEKLAKIGSNMERVHTKSLTILSGNTQKLARDELRAVKLYNKDISYFRDKKENRNDFYSDNEII